MLAIVFYPLILKDLFHLDKTITTPGTQDERGSGPGLILCKEFIEKQNGAISAKSEPGKGSIFSINLPKTKLHTD